MLISTIIKYQFSFKNVSPKTNSLRPPRLNLSSSVASLHNKWRSWPTCSRSSRDFLPSSQPFSAGFSSALEVRQLRRFQLDLIFVDPHSTQGKSVSNPCRQLEVSLRCTEMVKPRMCLQSHSQRRWDHSCCQAQIRDVQIPLQTNSEYSSEARASDFHEQALI